MAAISEMAAILVPPLPGIESVAGPEPLGVLSGDPGTFDKVPDALKPSDERDAATGGAVSELGWPEVTAGHSGAYAARLCERA